MTNKHYILKGKEIVEADLMTWSKFLVTEKNKMKKSKLKKLSSAIQVCDLCGKVDAYKGDKHNCDPEYQESRREAQGYYT